MCQGGELEATTIEQLTCLLYGNKTTSNVNSVQNTKLIAQAKCRKTGEKLKNIQRVHYHIMPPCRKVLIEKIRRAQLVAMMCTRAEALHLLITYPLLIMDG